MIKVDILKEIYLFKDMTPDQLKKVGDICRENTMIAGQEVFMMGQKAESFFVIQQGSIKLTRSTPKGDDVQISTLGSGSHFGEMPFLCEDTRTANAQCTENCYLIEIPFALLKTLLSENTAISDKFYRATSHYLAKRLKATTTDLTAFAESKLRSA